MICPEIKEYVCADIIIEYSSFDKGHDLKHVDRVINNSLSIAMDYNVNMNMVYVIAAYHDLGLRNGRAEHEKTSGIILISDQNLKKWFTEDEIYTMKEAVEDHRASNNYEPRSIYGKIIAEADRDIDYMTILTRTIQYGMKNYPDYNFEQHLERNYGHIQEKYGENGYIKLWLNTELNQQKLAELRCCIQDAGKFRADFKKIYDAM